MYNCLIKSGNLFVYFNIAGAIVYIAIHNCQNMFCWEKRLQGNESLPQTLCNLMLSTLDIIDYMDSVKSNNLTKKCLHHQDAKI